MNQTILFTPVGGTDPISSTNIHDGSMLHICRVYQPQKVILYMSKEMLDNQEKDNRYRYCLDRLAQMQNRSVEYEVIERRELTQVHEFDYFYQDFREIISSVYQTMDETDTLLLNISSGTPAMKSGLAVLRTIGEFPAKLIQVETPEKKINEHIHKNYDVVTLWELNEDNAENYENRCKEIQCPTLANIKKEEIIKKHVLAYNYSAALDIAETLPDELTKRYKDLLTMAYGRTQLDFKKVDQMIQKTGVQCLPVRSSSERKYFEYALNIELRLKKEEYVDFVRSITPLIVDLFEIILKKECKIDINKYCTVKKKNGKRTWSEEKLEGTKIGKTMESYFMGQNQRFKGGDISSRHLKILIEAFSADEHLKRLVNDVRSVEKNIRNLAAHEIVSVTEETILALTGFGSEKIMAMIKELFRYTGISVRKEYWNSYDEMNAEILKRMSVNK